ncbi:response regulator [Haliscomenobacter sp.]|uniref:response regulator transcription factor n=1 Tax=Haliscomenobacter sp. TaxID=2717303 RepID=UPI003593F94F
METPIKIGLVDDQNLFREGMKLILSTFSELEVVLEADGGSSLLAQLETNQPDVILLDYTMPEMDGFQTMQKVKAAYPGIKVIMLTMHFDEALMAFMMQNGANGYLLKDENSHTVKTAIIQVMESGQYFADYVSKALLKQLQIQSQKPQRSGSLIKENSFSEREQEILAIVGKYGRQEMADKLFLSIKTVDFHLKNLRDKTNANSSAELVRYAMQHGFQGD